MTHRDDDERSTEESPETKAQSSEAPSETSGADAAPEPEPDERDPEVAEIEDDPSRNPDNELLRDIKGG